MKIQYKNLPTLKPNNKQNSHKTKTATVNRGNWVQLEEAIRNYKETE